MSAEHGGHAPAESRLVVWSREKMKLMMEVISKSFNSLTHAILSVISGGQIIPQDAPETSHH